MRKVAWTRGLLRLYLAWSLIIFIPMTLLYLAALSEDWKYGFMYVTEESIIGCGVAQTPKTSRGVEEDRQTFRQINAMSKGGHSIAAIESYAHRELNDPERRTRFDWYCSAKPWTGADVEIRLDVPVNRSQSPRAAAAAQFNWFVAMSRQALLNYLLIIFVAIGGPLAVGITARWIIRGFIRAE